MPGSPSRDRLGSLVVRARQSLQAILGGWRPLLLALLAICLARPSHADLFDALDAYPPRWQLDTSDSDARVITQKHLIHGGIDGGGCEQITFESKLGSEAIFAYPIEPVRPVDDLVASVSILSAKSGARIGLRVRFPYAPDTQTRRPMSVNLYGAQYDRPGKFEKIGVGSIERALRIKIANLRGAHGASVNLDDPYVDAIIVNAYSGPGTTSVRVDQLSVRGMISVGDHGRVDQVPTPTSSTAQNGGASTRMLRMDLTDTATEKPSSFAAPFPRSTVIRILEHNGEPLSWVRSLGFDAILLASPPTSELLRDAIKSRLLVYAPPPTAPDPSLQMLLDPVVAWYLGGGLALDNSRVAQTDKTVRRLRNLPRTWQRPIVTAATESWSRYASFSDGIVSDLPTRVRDIPASEQIIDATQRHRLISGSAEVAIAVQSSQPRQLVSMNRAIAQTTGAPTESNFRWHSLWAQAIQALEHSPRAILFRSNDSLVSGTSTADQRSMALSYINRSIATIAPWVASSKPGGAHSVEGATYRCGTLRTQDAELLLLTSEQTRGDEMLAGDGSSVDVLLPPERAGAIAWRLTDFSAERIEIDSTPTGARLQIVSPDVVEIVVISRNAELGRDLATSTARFAKQAAADRWQLAAGRVASVRQAWNHAVGAGVASTGAPVGLLTVAERTIRDAEPAYRSGDTDATLRLARRADAWALRAGWQLSDALMPDWSNRRRGWYTSCPPIEGGRHVLQTAWHPLMSDDGWSDNLLATGGLDQSSALDSGGWKFGRRKVARSVSSASWVSRGFFSGIGGVRLAAASSTDAPLGGGYEGTVSVFSSPAVRIEPGSAVRIDAMIRTIGFGGPHQGVLVHDNLGGQELGKLVRGATDWTRVRLYRHSVNQNEVRASFETIGDGEAFIDEVEIRVWRPDALPPLPVLRSLP